MFAVIYKFKLKAHQEEAYQRHWHEIASYFIKNRGAIGSCLHKAEDGLWVAYSRWPDRATRDASWPGDETPNSNLPIEVKYAIEQIQALKKENSVLEADIPDSELCLEVVEDLLLTPPGRFS